MANIVHSDPNERIDSERAYHNKRFSGEKDLREPLNHWYAALSHGRDKMQDLIRRYAKNADVLEYGSADGGNMEFHQELAALGARYNGIDISNEAVARATDKAQSLGLANFKFSVMNAEKLEYPDNSFDLVFGTGILHHLDLNKAYAEISRVLRPGGHAVFYEPMGHNPILNAFRNRTPDMRTPDEHPFMVSDFDKARPYFSDVKVDYYGLATVGAIPLRKLPIGPAAMRLCEMIDEVINVIPYLGRYAWHAVIDMKK